MENFQRVSTVFTIKQEKNSIYMYILFSCLRQDTKEKYIVDAPVRENNIKKKKINDMITITKKKFTESFI